MAFLVATLALAFASSPGVHARALTGEPIVLGAAGRPQVVVRADSGCTPCITALLAFEQAGFDVAWVATDRAGDGALLRMRAQRAGLSSRVVADPEDQLARRLRLPASGGVVVFDASGRAALVGPDLAVDGARTLALARAAFPEVGSVAASD